MPKHKRAPRAPGSPPSSDGAWQPLRRGNQILSPALAAMATADPAVAALVKGSAEVWLNDRYVVVVHRSHAGRVEVLSVRRADRSAVHDWRDLQLIKNQLAGPHTEAFELYPDEDRLVDTANQYWLWCMPPGVRLPVGFGQRSVLDVGEGPDIGAQQRPLGVSHARESA
jgi:hypothetical protein